MLSGKKKKNNNITELARWLSGEEFACSTGDVGGSVLVVRKIPWRREWGATPVFLPGKSHGWGSLAGYSLWSCKESDTTQRLKKTTK